MSLIHFNTSCSAKRPCINIPGCPGHELRPIFSRIATLGKPSREKCLIKWSWHEGHSWLWMPHFSIRFAANSSILTSTVSDLRYVKAASFNNYRKHCIFGYRQACQAIAKDWDPFQGNFSLIPMWLALWGIFFVAVGTWESPAKNDLSLTFVRDQAKFPLKNELSSNPAVPKMIITPSRAFLFFQAASSGAQHVKLSSACGWLQSAGAYSNTQQISIFLQ